MKIESKYEIVLSDEDLRRLVAKELLEKAGVSISTGEIMFRQPQPVERDGRPMQIEAVVRGTQKKEVP